MDRQVRKTDFWVGNISTVGPGDYLSKYSSKETHNKG